jgi:DNA invertase Pin-like site-specific DNA recombinase
MRAALYARVSTVDRGQDHEVQLGDLREYAVPRDFEVVVEFVDFASGKGRPARVSADVRCRAEAPVRCPASLAL